MRRSVLACLFLAAALGPFPAVGQVVAGAGVRLQSMRTLDGEAGRLGSLRLLSVPFRAEVRVPGPVVLEVSGAWADAALTLSNGARAVVTGPTDVTARLRSRVGPFDLAVGGVAPTGAVVGTLEDAAVVGQLSGGLMPFDIGQWGGGGALSGELGFALRVEATSTDIRLGYVERASIEPLDVLAYQPGSEFRVRAHVDAALRRSDRLSLLFGYQRYAADALDGANLFTPGGRMTAGASYVLAVGARESARMGVSLDRTDAGVLAWDRPLVPRLGDRLPGATAGVARLVLQADAELLIARDGMALMPRVEGRVVRRPGGTHQGWLLSAGGRARYGSRGALSALGLTLLPDAMVRFGRLIVDDVTQSAVVGFDLGLGVQWGGAR